MALGAETLSNSSTLAWRRDIQRQQLRCAEENGLLRSMYKRAKADGVNVVSLRRAIRATKLDPDEVVANLRDEIRYMDLMRIPMSAETLFDGFDLNPAGKSVRPDDEWDAEAAGYRAGRLGVKIDECPYTPESELFAHWDEYWRKGKAAVERENGPNAETVAPRRGRPPKQARIPGTEEQDRPRKKAAGAAPKKAARKTGRRSGRRGNGQRPSIATEDGQPVY